jgi:two-component system KDP operon response regulator KdpE
MGIAPVFYPPSQSQPWSRKSNKAYPTNLRGRLLIVSEDVPARRALHTTLYSLGFDVGEAASREEATALCRAVNYDAILLDADMPSSDGIETFAELRGLLPRSTILMLSVDNDQERKLEALEAGADDYLTKPFHMRELTARIRAAQRRAHTAAEDEEHVITIGEVSLNPTRYLVQKAGQRIRLTPKEFDLLSCLMVHPGIPVTHERLLHTLWGDDYGSQVEGLRTFVRQLRKKIEDNPGAPRYILTESRIGYRFADPAELA